jgi:eukaryotic-like serine/threonine-protein kinase
MHKLGDAIGRFTLQQELGRGPMSEVFLAVERDTGWKVACKIFLLEPGSRSTDHAAWAQRMVREASAAAQLKHENIVRVFEVGMLGATPYLVRDFIVGKSLAEYVGDGEGASLEVRLAWLRDLARALAEIHRAGLVHRDLKPSNVLIRRDGAVRLLDFGVARRSVDREAGLVGPTVDRLPSGTERLRVLGNPAYMAPERFAHLGTSPLADQFGWGVLAYELLAGRLPWGPPGPPGPPGPTGEAKRLRPIRTIDAILTQAPSSVRTLAPKVPPGIDGVIARAMAKAPAARFPSMDYVLRALDEAVR